MTDAPNAAPAAPAIDMPLLHDARLALSQVSRMFRSLAALDDALAGFQSLAQAKHEQEDAIAKLAEERRLSADTAADSRAEVERRLVEASERGQKLLEGARAEANTILARAKADAAMVREAAAAELDRMRATAAEQVGRWTTQANELKAEWQQTTADVERLQAMKGVLIKDLSELKAEHDRLKDLHAEIAGRMRG